MRVLFVDDYPETADALAELAGLLGHDALGACSYNDALSKARISVPDIIFLDLRLGPDDGRDLCRYLKNMPALSGTRYIAVTGADTSELQCEEDLFEDIIAKPVDIDTLTRLLDDGTG